MFEKILVPVDGSKRSERAINIAVGLAAIHGAELLMLHVYRHHSLREQSMSMVRPADPGNIDIAQREYASEVVEWAKSLAVEKGAANVKTIVKSGQPARVIVSVAQETDAGVIVIGSRGLGDLQGFLLGSVSHKVTSLSEVPVLVV